MSAIRPTDSNEGLGESGQEVPGSTGPTSSAGETDEPGARILHVNDDDAIRYAVTRTLRKAGLTVQEAATGAEALRLAAAGPDLVVLDVELPDIDGFEVCRRIKANPALASTLVLQLSARFVKSEDRVHGLEGGADGYLVQPFEPAELIATVRSLLRLRRAERRAETAALQWQATFDAISDGVCLTDREGRILRCNQAFVRFLTRPVEEILGRPYADLLATWAGDAESPVRPDVSGREGVELAVGKQWFRMRSDPVLDQGTASGTVHILVEVTDRKRVEEAEASAQRNAERVEQLENELRSLERLGSPPAAGPPGPGLSLKGSDPGAFQELVRSYGELLEMALEQRQYRLTHDISAGLRTLGDHLGGVGAGPRDVIEIHNAVLQAKRGRSPSARMQAYLEEARLLLLELMGDLVSHYRKLTPGIRKPSAWPTGTEEVPHG